MNHGWVSGFWVTKEPRNDLDSDLQRHRPPRTKQSHPYAYDPFTIWGRQDPTVNDSVYTDRLWSWDSEKTRRIGKEVFGADGFWFGSSMSPQKVEKFLRLWQGDDSIVLTRVIEFCDVATGYPTWLLVYRSNKKLEGRDTNDTNT